MTVLDIAIAVILVVSVLIGVYRGFIRESLSLAILAAALIVAAKFSELPKTWLPDIELWGYALTGAGLQFGLVFALLFIAVLAVGHFVNNAVSAAVRRSFMSLFDRLLGAVFGCVRGGVIVLALVLLAGLTRLPFADGWRTSLLIPPFEWSARYVICHAPQAYQSTHYACVSGEPEQRQREY